MNVLPKLATTTAVLVAAGASSSAQFGNAWLTCEPAPEALEADIVPDPFTEATLVVGDLDGSSLEDLVAVRRKAYGSASKRPTGCS